MCVRVFASFRATSFTFSLMDTLVNSSRGAGRPSGDSGARGAGSGPSAPPPAPPGDRSARAAGARRTRSERPSRIRAPGRAPAGSRPRRRAAPWRRRRDWTISRTRPNGQWRSLALRARPRATVWARHCSTKQYEWGRRRGFRRLTLAVFATTPEPRDSTARLGWRTRARDPVQDALRACSRRTGRFGFGRKTFHAPVIRVVEGLAYHHRAAPRGDAPDPVTQMSRPSAASMRLLSRAVDLVVIATPNASHHPIAKQCLLAGRPTSSSISRLRPTVAEAEELVRLGRQRGACYRPTRTPATWETS